ncbi:MAG TPA: AarF/UbiB family protein [Burkholderiales bacterium]|nr:AarF/UbiB family protein [Burkholderiales bacterium]
MAWETLSAMRDLPRLHEITTVFIRHGLGDIVRRLGIGTVLERAGRILHWGERAATTHLEPAQRIRLALEELGPTFVKLGQVLSTRVDLFPPHWIAEFEKLQSSVPPVPFSDLLPELEQALGRSPFEVFPDLDTTPYASASIAQVHRAKLADGTPVILKIRRPGIRAKIDADLRILAHVAHLIEAELPDARRYAPAEIAAEFARSLARELDLAMEARNIDRFSKNFANDPTVVIPKVYWDWTSEVMNVQSHIEAIQGNDLAAIQAAGLDRKELAQRGAAAVLKMILIDGFFHADPHPGNVFYLPGNRIAMIDFGMVGRLTPHRRGQVIDLLAGMARVDDHAMLEVLLDWSGDAYVDQRKLAVEMDELVFQYEDMPLKDIRIGVVLRQFTAIMRQHSIVLPSDLTLMFKALITLEGLGRQYDPNFHILDHLTPLLKRAMNERYRPTAMVRRGTRGFREMLEVVASVPRDLAALVRDARRGKMRVDINLRQLDRIVVQLDHTIDRITVGIMTASLVIGSSIVLTVPGQLTFMGVPLLTLIGVSGYVLAFCNSLWIIIGIWREGRE